MKKFRLFLVAVIALMATACGYGIEDVAQDVIADIESQLEAEFGEDVYVGEIVLVHVGGNEYEGIVDISVGGETEVCDVDVLFDGSSYKWELY